MENREISSVEREFPYFFVGTFIEAVMVSSFTIVWLRFPYFFVGTFIEALFQVFTTGAGDKFPYFFVGTFIEAGGCGSFPRAPCGG